MRASVIGAYFHDEKDKVIAEATKSAEVTHSNKDGICGAIGVALASMYSTRIGINKERLSPKEFIAKVGEIVPDSDTKYKILKGLTLSSNAHIEMLRTVPRTVFHFLQKDLGIPFSAQDVDKTITDSSRQLT